MQQRVMDVLESGLLPSTGYLFKISDSKWLIRWGTGEPTGTPDACIYIRTDSTSEDTQIYTFGNGSAWADADL